MNYTKKLTKVLDQEGEEVALKEKHGYKQIYARIENLMYINKEISAARRKEIRRICGNQ